MAEPSQDPGDDAPQDADVQLILLHRQYHSIKAPTPARSQLRRLLTRRQPALVHFVESRAKGNRGSVSVRNALLCRATILAAACASFGARRGLSSGSRGFDCAKYFSSAADLGWVGLSGYALRTFAEANNRERAREAVALRVSVLLSTLSGNAGVRYGRSVGVRRCKLRAF